MKVNVILGSSCNLRCNYCIAKVKRFDNSAVNTNDFCKQLNSIVPTIDKISFGGGEPLLYKKYITSIVDYFEQQGTQFVITSNGTLIDKQYVNYANNHNIFTVVSLGQNLDFNLIEQLDRLSYSYTITNNSSILNIPDTSRMVHFQCQHNVDGIPFIDTQTIDRFFTQITNNCYLGEKFKQYWQYLLSKQKNQPACWNNDIVSIDMHLNRYLCLRKLDSKIGVINQNIFHPIRFYNEPCQSCHIKTICRGGCIVSLTPQIECYYFQKAYEFYNQI